MGREAWPDLSVQISRRRWRCVLDPLLCLSGAGAALARGLAAHAEIWLAPEFHHILDGWTLYDGKPELLLQGLPTQTRGCAYAEEDLREAMRAWLLLREDLGHGGGRLYWVRDCLRESSLPPGMEDSVLPRWELLAEGLEERLSKTGHEGGPLVAALRDTAALVAALPGALLLSLREPPRGRESHALPQLEPTM